MCLPTRPHQGMWVIRHLQNNNASYSPTGIGHAQNQTGVGGEGDMFRGGGRQLQHMWHA